MNGNLNPNDSVTFPMGGFSNPDFSNLTIVPFYRGSRIVWTSTSTVYFSFKVSVSFISTTACNVVLNNTGTYSFNYQQFYLSIIWFDPRNIYDRSPTRIKTYGSFSYPQNSL